MTQYEAVSRELLGRPRRWLVTGAAGFIGSNLVQRLLQLGQHVVGLDNFATGRPENLNDVRDLLPTAAWSRFTFLEGDIRELDVCREACGGIDVVLHQAALGSVPRSIADPLSTHLTNVGGFFHMLVAAREAGVGRFVFASSSSVYGDSADLPKTEPRIGRQLSPYAVTKYVDELYASIFARSYALETVGLRYFNVFGRRQDPEGAYAAVIPRWIAALEREEACVMFGDGSTTRDFCFVDNVVQANILAATCAGGRVNDQVFNVACGERTSLLDLFHGIRDAMAVYRPGIAKVRPVFRDFRPGDVRHSLADISKCREALGYVPSHSLDEGLAETLPWYLGLSTLEKSVGRRVAMAAD